MAPLRPRRRLARTLVLLLLAVLEARCGRAALAAPVADWPYTEGAPGGGRYSPLDEIDRENVGELEVVWTYHHGDVFDGGWHPAPAQRGTAFQSTPLVVNGRLVFTTPYNRVIALDPERGTELWTFDPAIDRDRLFGNSLINRGVAYWRDATRAEGACTRRVFLATLDARLIALDAATGRPCADFGQSGSVDLRVGITPLVDDWEYNVTSPATVVGDVVVVGSSIADLIRRVGPPGDVRAFDARTGALLWTFHTIPAPGEPGAETWKPNGRENAGHANVWSTITADLERGLVFLPVATASPDFYGGDRLGANLFSDSVVALEAKTGRLVWHYQTVHHDLWDYDLAAPPNLVRIRVDGRERDAVAQATKTGFVFLLDRDTGEPLFPVEERAVPASDVPGEEAWPTQPFPVKPPPLVPQRLTEDDLWDADPERLEGCKERLRELRNDGIFTPPSLRGSVLYPFTGGGANWSGASFDPALGLLFVPVNNLVHVLTLSELPESNKPTFAWRPLHLLEGLWFLLTGRGTGLHYWVHPSGGRVVLREDDVPCNRPPWGWLVAVDLGAGEIRWRAPMGEKDGVQGLNGYGPPLATAGGLVFHAGTRDLHLRAHDAETGEVLARFALPAGLHAGPISYRLHSDGPQYLVIAPGGHVQIGSQLGDSVIGYALPESVRARRR
jgi:quinoprotein glucose dehydrogenase